MRKIFIICSALFSLSLVAQNNLDSVIVSSSRLQVKKYESGKNITIIDSKQINELPVTSVDELLQYVGGVNLNSRGGFGVQSDIGMRGSTFSQVLVMVDNQRINDPLTAHFNSNIPIPLSEVHHIEIVRGSAAASFGADAVGGIIHIKTKTYQGLWEDDASELNGNVTFGENNLTMTDVGFRKQSKHFGFSAAMKSSQSLGQQFINPSHDTGSFHQGFHNNGDSLYNYYFDLKTYTAALTYRTKKFKVYARGGMDTRDFAAKYFYTASSLDESIEKVSSYWTQAAAIYESESSKTELNASYRNNYDSFAFNPAFAANVHTSQRINATLSQQRKIKGISLNYGLQSDWQDIVSTDRGDHRITSNAAFIIANKKINNLILNGGLRIENSEKIGTQLVPQINAAYKHKKLIFRSSLGRSIRQADFTERFISYKLTNLSPGRNVGNPDLEAESAYTFDAGVDAYISKNLQISNTIFLRQSSNLIDYTLTNSSEINNLTNLQDSSNYLYANNISEAFTFGNEFGLKYRTDLPLLSIDWLLNYTYTQTNTPDSVTSKYIANHPLHNINGGATLHFGRFNWNIGGTFITRNADSIPSIEGNVKNQYGVINTKLSYTAKDIPVSVFVNVRNLLDSDYQEILGARMPNRWIMGGISWNFKYRRLKPVLY